MLCKTGPTMRIYVMIIILALYLISCGKAPVSYKKELSSPEPPTIKFVVAGDSAVCIAQTSFQAPQELIELARDLKDAKFIMSDRDGDEIVTLKPETLGKSFWKVAKDNVRGTIVLYSKFQIDDDMRQPFRCGLTLESSRYFLRTEAPVGGLNASYNFNGSDPGVILFSYPEISADKILLRAVALRNFNAEEEYLPSSESVRGEIWNERGAQVFNSGKNKSFLTVIKKVEPQSPGDYKLYTVEYGPEKVDKPILSAGKYKARITIPSKPFQYYSQMEFYLEGR